MQCFILENLTVETTFPYNGEKKKNQQYETQTKPRFYAGLLDQIFIELNLPLCTGSLSKYSTITTELRCIKFSVPTSFYLEAD